MKLKGFASLPADTFAEGPQSGADNGNGEPISANGRTGPFDGQPVQGFSGVQFAPSGGGSFWFLSDNGFGAQENSADYLLRLYQVNPDFKGAEDGDGSVEIEGFVQLSDPDGKIPFKIVNEDSSGRFLTGADFDIESFVIDAKGDIWIGDEFGPFILHFDSTGKLLEAPISTPNIPGNTTGEFVRSPQNPDLQFNSLNGDPPLVIAHRGASGERPEHTLEAYALAIEQGADFIEPDLVITKDGVLIARHEPLLDDTTNVADVFGEDRKSTKLLDGEEITGYFAEDFTLAEIKQLRAVQSRDFRSDEFDGQFEIPTFKEVIELLQQVEAETGKKIGIYPETKHPTFFDDQGLSLEEPLIATLQETGFTDPSRIFIQSFEVANLIDLQNNLLPAAGLENLPLVQLYGDVDDQFLNAGGGGFSAPYDIVANFSKPDFTAEEARATYGDLVDIVPDFGADVTGDGIPDTTYQDLATQTVFDYIGANYAEGVGPWKNSFLLRESIDTPVDGNGDGIAEITTQLTGEVRPFIDWAHDAGLQIHPYTLRNEERFLTLNPDGTPQSPEDEFRQLIELGVDGFFTDFPETGRIVVDQETILPNLSRSRGFEGMAFSPDRTTLYPLLEGVVDGDPEDALRIYEFDVASSEYQGLVGFYRTDVPGHPIGDFTPINDNEFLVIERDGKQGAEAQFKKIFKIDLSEIDENGFVAKEEVVDLLNIPDPDDLNGDGELTFTFPFVTIEDVLVIDQNTILVANDNNYPFSVGRGPDIDNNEVILIELDQPLDVDPLLGLPAPNFISGTPDSDEIVGELGNDFITAGEGNDTVDGGLGNDLIQGEAGDDVLQGDFADSTIGGDDVIFGGLGNDRINGNLGNDKLYGGAGDDFIFGNEGDDLIRGGLGNDFLTGDDSSGISGSDTFVLAAGEGTDFILDFQAGVDLIGLADGLTFGQLSIEQDSQNARISLENQLLATFAIANPLTEADFTII
ncbi:MAG: glycerophosphodiester phosphodiesterase [Moorea sp. SIO1G6]|uniref:esterase-like activity of phytase family protein n=1 Tax=Moorena sp. SIO1G6 TaxID=2607840 RepID=UPI0013C0BC7E|nr:esterase-like activity of phytase family protein [Moorena sp. SIO1G6]NET65052.1 glycerophosphodiester phosphodiesterase [Moorena sp. SIO1G6]